MTIQDPLEAQHTASLKSGQGSVRIPSARKTFIGIPTTTRSTTVPIIVCMMVQVCGGSLQTISTPLTQFQAITSEICRTDPNAAESLKHD
jgi:hypothetical protein